MRRDETSWAFRQPVRGAGARTAAGRASSTTCSGPSRRSSTSSSSSPTWSRDAPILLICLARPELLDERPGWGGGKFNATSVLLERLSEDDSAELIANLLGRAQLDRDIQERIMGAAEGNPLFVEEMLGMLIDDGLFDPQERRLDRRRRPLAPSRSRRRSRHCSPHGSIAWAGTSGR